MSDALDCRQIKVLTDREVDLSGSVITIGAFDGVHIGHQMLIRRTNEAAQQRSLPSVVWTFDPPPKVYLSGVQQLTTLNEKISRISALRPDLIVVSRFDDCFRRIPAHGFIDRLRKAAPVEIHVGEDFRFGAKQKGDVGMLAAYFDVSLHRPVRCQGGLIVSSTRIREMLKNRVSAKTHGVSKGSSPDQLLALI